MQIIWCMTPNLKRELVFFALEEKKKKTQATHDTYVSKSDQHFLTSLSVIKLEPLAIDGIHCDGLIYATKVIILTSMSLLHNIWAFPIWCKLGKGRYFSSYIIYYPKNELAFHKDLFTHILLIHAAHLLSISPYPLACDVVCFIHCFQVHHPCLSTHIRICFKLLALQCVSY